MQMPRDLIDPVDGENQAVRSFLMQYGTPGLTVGKMKTNLRLAGWDGYWPEWANEQDKHHLTKGGAQHWLRHLFALETSDGVSACDETLNSMDWTRLANGDRRALNPANQWAFDKLADGVKEDANGSV
jgi:hypothetical protein